MNEMIAVMNCRKNKMRIKLIILIIVISGVSCSKTSAEEPADFISEAQKIYTIAACGQGKIPDGIDERLVDEYCSSIHFRSVRFRKNFAEKAGPFISKLLPEKIPSKVVYPFGGCDLITGMVTYPDAKEFTVISLEAAGDPRGINNSITKAALKNELARLKSLLGDLLERNDNTNVNVRTSDNGLIPGQLAFSLLAASVLGYRPVSLRYFILNEDGSIKYLTSADIEAVRSEKIKKLHYWWHDTDYSVAFRNMEIVLKKISRDSPGADTVTQRHISFNLSDKYFKNSPLLKHLEKKGKVSAIIKAGSYLVWMDDFSAISNYLLSNMSFMVSDSTGFLPAQAEKARFEMITYGKFYGAFLENNGGAKAEQLRNFFNSQPYRPLPFRYGHSDIKGASHMIITKPAR